MHHNVTGQLNITPFRVSLGPKYILGIGTPGSVISVGSWWRSARPVPQDTEPRLGPYSSVVFVGIAGTPIGYSPTWFLVLASPARGSPWNCTMAGPIVAPFLGLILSLFILDERWLPGDLGCGPKCD